MPQSNLYVPRHIAGSPFPLAVTAGAAFANVSGAGSVAFGPGLVSGVAGHTLSFSIAARDRFGNDRLSYVRVYGVYLWTYRVSVYARLCVCACM